MYGRNGVAPTVGQHGAFDVGVVHLHHEGARDAGALLQPQARLHVLILLSNKTFQHQAANGNKVGSRNLVCTLSSFLPYASGGTVPDVVAGVSAAVAGVVCREAGARLGAVAARLTTMKENNQVS